MTEPGMARRSPNEQHPMLDVEFIVQELFDAFNDTDAGGKMTLVSMPGSKFHARVLNAAKHLGII